MRILPHRFDAAALVDVLSEIGLALPPSAVDLARKEIRLSAAGLSYSVDQIDAVLAKTELSVTDRLTIKVAMGQQGLIR